jgi:hypothetical protein
VQRIPTAVSIGFLDRKRKEEKVKKMQKIVAFTFFSLSPKFQITRVSPYLLRLREIVR